MGKGGGGELYCISSTVWQELVCAVVSSVWSKAAVPLLYQCVATSRAGACNFKLEQY